MRVPESREQDVQGWHEQTWCLGIGWQPPLISEKRYKFLQLMLGMVKFCFLYCSSLGQPHFVPSISDSKFSFVFRVWMTLRVKNSRGTWSWGVGVECAILWDLLWRAQPVSTINMGEKAPGILSKGELRKNRFEILEATQGKPVVQTLTCWGILKPDWPGRREIPHSSPL